MRFRAVLLTFLFACGVEYDDDIDDDDEDDAAQVLPGGADASTPGVPDVRCADVPVTDAATGFRNTGSSLIANGDAYHRGTDLIATTETASHTLTGKLTYTDLDKDLEDEDVELFACIDSQWQLLGETRSNDDGRFTFSLTGDARLPAGIRDVYVSVKGDRSGAAFLALVTPPGHRVIVSDVDGTLTESENSYPISLATDGVPAAHPHAPEALASAIGHGVSVVYITARGDRFTQDTREWFAAKGFPRGPIRMPSAIITLPGDETVEFKTDALQSLAGLELVGGIGNRNSDIEAYTSAGLTPDRILIKLPEYSDELEDALEAGRATGFELYDHARTHHIPALMF